MLQGFARLVRPNTALGPWIVSEAERARRVEAFERACRQAGRLRLVGPRGVGKKFFVQTMLRWRKQPLLVVDARHWFDVTLARQAAFDESVGSLILEAMMRNAAICLDVDGDERLDPTVARAIERGFQRFPGLLIVADRRDRPGQDAEVAATVIQVPMPTVDQRIELWRQCLSRAANENVDVTGLQGLAQAFALTAGQIAGAVESAVEQEGDAPNGEALWAAAQRQVTHSLAGLAERIDGVHCWDDVVLPEAVRNRLMELRAFAARRQQVYEEWGFGQKFPGGRGLTALFHGLPGTGKTMVAEILARELGLELFRVDLSRVVSKWVGETEKNLATIFDAAEHAQALLLFDEADALFSTRTEVRSANDRYGNLEVNYLLQRMEQFDGTTILTTNHASALDKAFQRRLRFRVLFPPPDVAARMQLWQRMIPDEAPIEASIAWHKLAEAFDLTGGHIKNAVIRAAFCAADRGGVICFEDLKQAAIIECSETGRLVKA